MKTAKGLLITLGYIFTYLLGFAICIAIYYLFLQNIDDDDNTIAYIVSGVALLLVAPSLAMGYHKLLEKYDII